MKIVRLAPSQRREGRWLVGLEDGSLLRVTRNEVADFALYQGLDLDSEALAALSAAAAASAMEQKALSALSARPMSRRELTDRLAAPPRRSREDGEPLPSDGEALRAQAEAVAGRMEELGLLNDGEYAAQVARHYAAKGFGPRKIRDELYRRGVPREHWDAALEGLDDPAGILDALLEKKLRGWDGDPKELKHASDALARRGFDWEDVSAALERCRARLKE